MSTSSIKRQIRRFCVVVVQWTSKKCTKKRDARAELLFWSLIKPIVFWSRRCGCRRRRSCLSSLMSTINDILAAVSLQTALSPGPFPMTFAKLLDARTFNILRCDNLLFLRRMLNLLVYWITVSNSESLICYRLKMIYLFDGLLYTYKIS